MIDALEMEPAVRELHDAPALDCAEQLVRWADENSRTFDVDLLRARVWHWRSFEDTSVEQAVIELHVTGDDESAQRFWDAAANSLGTAIHACPSPSAERLSVEVRW